MEPGTKVAIISKSGECVTHGAPSDEKTPKKIAPPPPSAAKKKKSMPKTETTPVAEKPKGSLKPPVKPSAAEPQLPPKDRERRVSMNIINIVWIVLDSSVIF